MGTLFSKIEKTLEPIFDGLPPLPKDATNWLVKAWPIIALVAGVLQLLAAWSLWHVGHLVNSLVNYSNALAQIYGTGGTINHLGLFYWLGLIALAVDGFILLLAYPGLKARSQAGWNFLFLGAIVNVLYGVFSAFDSTYGGVSKLVFTLIGSAIGFYFLFQVRSYYTGKKTSKKQA